MGRKQEGLMEIPRVVRVTDERQLFEFVEWWDDRAVMVREMWSPYRERFFYRDRVSLACGRCVTRWDEVRTFKAHCAMCAEVRHNQGGSDGLH